MTDDEEHPYRWAVDTPPIGTWETPLYVLMEDILRFDKDGTGLWVSYSGMRGEERRPLEWRHEGPGRMRIRFPDDEAFPPPGADERYGVIRYRTDWISNEAGGRTPVLRSIDDDGFWMLLAPISFRRQGFTEA